MSLGRIPLYAANRKQSSSAFDPSQLALSGWWRASFASAPWVGTASAGASGGRNFINGTEPAVGTAQNGFSPASFDGTDDNLITELPLDSYFSATAYTVVLLVKPLNPSPPAAQIFSNEQLISDDGGNFGVAFYDDATPKLVAWHYDGGWKETSGLAMTPSVYQMVAVTYNGATISLSVNGGSAVTVSAGNVLSLDVIYGRLGRGFAAECAEQDVLEVMYAQTALSAGDLSNIKTYFNTRYALSL